MKQLTDDKSSVITSAFEQSFCHRMCLDEMRITVWNASPLEYEYGVRYPDGLKDVSVHRDGYHFTLTSKILGERYSDRLNRETLPIALANCNRMGLRIDPEQVMTQGTCSAIHVTDDIKLSRPIIDYLLAILTSKTPFKWIPGKYLPETVTFKNQARSFNEYVSFYDKDIEFRKNPVPGVDPSSFKNTLRVEYKFTGGRKIQRELGIPHHTIQNVLSCTKPVNANLLSSWWRESSVPIPVNEDLKDEIFRLGAESLYRQFDGNPSRLSAYIRLRQDRSGYMKKKIFGILEAEPEQHDLIGEIIGELRT